MGPTDEDANLSAEVTSRLEELFGEEEGKASVPADASGESQSREAVRQTPSPEAADSGQQDSGSAGPIENLKALVFSIDWEITDATMKDFLKEIKRLKDRYKDDQISLIFLKLHESLGKYIKSRKAQAHPDATKLVASIYKKFEKILQSPGMSEAERKKIAVSAVKKYKKFQQQVMPEGEATAGTETVSATAQPPEAGGPEPLVEAEPEAEPAGGEGNISGKYREMTEQIIAELRKTIQAEFAELHKKLAKGSD
ncbi:MAG: hypothetical protein R6X08_07110 [Desulfosalsimonadaceae bacterium]